ncbi:MAG: hypothetical protein K6U14_08165 [Firmicutes bacterium]|nr:hypothetical protein [Alicyclobacillaceae bacterium]MCL6497588.1 hypothetical protein [Bacillota bacterium]
MLGVSADGPASASWVGVPGLTVSWAVAEVTPLALAVKVSVPAAVSLTAMEAVGDEEDSVTELGVNVAVWDVEEKDTLSEGEGYARFPYWSTAYTVSVTELPAVVLDEAG